MKDNMSKELFELKQGMLELNTEELFAKPASAEELGIKLDCVLNIKVSDEYLAERITGRRTGLM